MRLLAALTTRAVPTIGATAMSTPWTSSSVMPTSTAVPALSRYEAGGRVHRRQRGDAGEHQLSVFEVAGVDSAAVMRARVSRTGVSTAIGESFRCTRVA